ncbi:MAG: YSC84-related protein [Planctomycetota bacterium]|nr:YSC84-related protein [Planctomycetota bacterium]MDA1142011.1 YSC84-related protein [Planctomycetota bacterium]
MKKANFIIGLLTLSAFLTSEVNAEFKNPFNKKTDDQRSKEVDEAIELFQGKDPSIKEVFKKANGYAVFPNVAKAGIGIGGAVGKGQLFEGEKLLGTTTLKQASFGLQLGGQTYSEIIFFETSAALEKFKQGKFELGAQVSAVAITTGAAAGAQFNNGIAVFTMTKKG